MSYFFVTLPYKWLCIYESHYFFQELQRQIARLASRVQLAERVNVDRKDDLQSLFNSFSHLTQSLMKSNNASGGKKPINLGIEAEAMLQGKNF